MKTKKIIYSIPAIIWLVFIFIMGSVKIEEHGKEKNLISTLLYNFKIFLIRKHNKFLTSLAIHIDKVYHSFEYFVFYFLLFLAIYKMYNISLKKKYIFSIIISIMVGITDELHQLGLPSRYCSLSDFFADVLGIMIMFIIIFFSLKYRRKNEI